MKYVRKSNGRITLKTKINPYFIYIYIFIYLFIYLFIHVVPQRKHGALPLSNPIGEWCIGK